MSKLFTSKPVSFVHPAVAALNLEDNRQAFGFVAASPDTNFRENMKALKEQIPLPMVGGTSLGNPFDTLRNPFGTSLAFLGKKGVKSAVVLSNPVGAGDSAELAEDLHRRAVEKLGVQPKLFIIFMPIVANLFADHIIGALYKAAGDVPVFGGMVSDDFNSDRSAVFCDGECHPDRIALVALGGDINPVFAKARELTFPSDYSPLITEAEGNVIRRVDGIPFGEYLKKFNIDASALEDFPISLRARNPNAIEDDDHMAIINLVKLEEDQSGVFGSNVTVGDSITLCYLARENIENSTKHCLEQLRERMAEKEREGYRFDMILAVSCVARYYVIIRTPGNFEAEALKAGIPEGIDAFGIFAFAEYGPVPDQDGGLKNAKHSQTLVMCAF